MQPLAVPPMPTFSPRYVAYLITVLVLVLGICLALHLTLGHMPSPSAITLLTFLMMVLCLPIILWKKRRRKPSLPPACDQ